MDLGAIGHFFSDMQGAGGGARVSELAALPTMGACQPTQKTILAFPVITLSVLSF
jgi:hypothetical protein